MPMPLNLAESPIFDALANRITDDDALVDFITGVVGAAARNAAIAEATLHAPVVERHGRAYVVPDDASVLLAIVGRSAA